MTRQCEKCGFVNQDDYDFCAKCGNPLIEGVQPRNFMVIKPEDIKINKKASHILYNHYFSLMERFHCRGFGKEHQNGYFRVFRIFYAFLSCPVKTSDHQKTWYNSAVNLIGWCGALILCDVALKKVIWEIRLE